MLQVNFSNTDTYEYDELVGCHLKIRRLLEDIMCICYKDIMMPYVELQKTV